MGRTRQYAGRVNVIKRIKIGKRWPFAAVVERNGKMVRDHVWVLGRDEHHPEGHYHSSGTKKENDGASRFATLRKLSKPRAASRSKSMRRRLESLRQVKKRNSSVSRSVKPLTSISISLKLTARNEPTSPTDTR